MHEGRRCRTHPGERGVARTPECVESAIPFGSWVLGPSRTDSFGLGIPVQRVRRSVVRGDVDRPCADRSLQCQDQVIEGIDIYSEVPHVIDRTFEQHQYVDIAVGPGLAANLGAVQNNATETRTMPLLQTVSDRGEELMTIHG